MGFGKKECPVSGNEGKEINICAYSGGGEKLLHVKFYIVVTK